MPVLSCAMPSVVHGGLRYIDTALARAAATGAADALGDLYQRHGQRVYALCLRMTRDASVAEQARRNRKHLRLFGGKL